MARFVVIRDDQHGGERLVEESQVPTEAALHDVLMRHPSLIPATDLGFGRLVTVGCEASLEAGSADLVLLDQDGQICIVEVKKAGNPDTRRVIAQLLDYASSLWGSTLDEFERAVLHRRLGDADPRSLREFVMEELRADDEDPDEAAERTLEALGETLRTGQFALVLAAPTIPDGVERVIEYLNARGLSLYGIEVSYFAGEVEAFIPRVVVRPNLGSRIAGQDVRARQTPMESDAYVPSLPEHARAPVLAFIQDMEELGGELQWRPYGPRVRVRGTSGPKVMVTLDSDRLSLTVGPRKGLDPAVGASATRALRDIPRATVRDDYGSLRWSNSAQEEIERALGVARELVRSLVAATADAYPP